MTPSLQRQPTGDGKSMHRLIPFFAAIHIAFAPFAGSQATAGPADIYEIQQGLSELGYEVGWLDGAWGRRTERAVRRFLKDKKHSPGSVFKGNGRDDNALLQLIKIELSKNQIAPAQFNDGVSNSIIAPQIGHSKEITAAAFSSDGRLILTASKDNSVKLWDRNSGILLRTLHGHLDSVTVVAFSPDSSRIASGSDDSTIKIWETHSGKQLMSLKGHEYTVWSVMFSDDSMSLISGSGDRNVNLWDLRAGKIVRTYTSEADETIFTVMYSSDRSQIIAASSWSVSRWDLESGELIRTLDISDQESRDWGDSSTVSSNGSMAIIFTGRKLNFWDLTSDKLIGSVKVPNGTRGPVSFTPDGRKLIMSTGDSVKIWDIASKKISLEFDTDEPVDVLAISPDGSEVIVREDRSNLKLFSLVSLELIRSFSGSSILDDVDSVIFSPDGSLVASVSEQLRIWDAENGQLVHALGDMSDWGRTSFIPAEYAQIAPGEVTDDSKLWRDWSDKIYSALASNTYRNSRVTATSPDGRYIASSRDENTIDLLDAKTSNRLRTFKGNAGRVMSIDFSPDGTRIVSGGSDMAVKLWDVASGGFIRSLNGHTDWIRGVDYSPDGSRIVSVGDDGTVRLWDAKSGQLLRTSKGIAREIRSVEFSPDGSKILSGGSNNTMEIWDVAGGERVATSVFGRGDGWLTITPEGFFTSSQDGARLLHIVSGLEVFPIDRVYQALYRPDLVREALRGDPDGKVAASAAMLNLDKVVESGGAPSVAKFEVSSRLEPNAHEPPPEIEADVVVDTDTVELTVRLTDQGGGIGRIEWRVNGMTLGVERGLTLLDESSGSTGGPASAREVRTVSRTIPLANGRNEIEVVAYNAANLIASKPETFVVEARIASGHPRLHVLSIGVNNYLEGRALRLRYAVPDAEDLADALQQSATGLYETVNVTQVLDKDVTDSNLDRVFAEVSRRIRPEDTFVLFTAGHGKTVDAEYYFIPQNFRADSDDAIQRHGIGKARWQQWLASIPARKGIWLNDSCESGSLTSGRPLELSSRGGVEGLLEQRTALNRLGEATGRMILTATTDDGPALEGYGGHGVFTYAILDALARGDRNGNGLIEALELQTHVMSTVPEISTIAFGYPQSPKASQTDFTDFALSRRSSELVPAPGSVVSAANTRPTHVITETTQIYAQPGRGPLEGRLARQFDGVILLREAGGWALIAKDGLQLGYVAEHLVRKIQ